MPGKPGWCIVNCGERIGWIMMKYKVKFAEFHSVMVEADSKKEAEEKAAVMDDEDILKNSIENSGMEIWNISELG